MGRSLFHWARGFAWWLAIAATTPAGGQMPAGLVHDFGTVRQGARVVHAFDIDNPRDRPWQLVRAEASAPGMRVSFPPSIAAGERGKITIEWDTTRLRGRVSGTALIESGGSGDPPLRLELSGVVQPLLEFRPRAAAFFSVWVGDAADQVITIVNNDDRPLRITRIEPNGGHFEAGLRTIAEGKEHELRITVPKGTEPGRFMESVTLYTDHPRYPSLRIPVNVLVKTDVYVNPETVEFGRLSPAALRPGTIDLLAQTFLLKKRAGALRIRSVETDVAGLVIRRDPVGEASDVFRIDVSLAADKLMKGSLNGTIRITTDDPDFPVVAVPVSGEVE